MSNTEEVKEQLAIKANQEEKVKLTRNMSITDMIRAMGPDDYSGPPAHLGRSSAQLDRASAHLMQSAVQPMLAAVQHTS